MDRTQKWMGSVGCLGQIENIKRQSLNKEFFMNTIAHIYIDENGNADFFR